MPSSNMNSEVFLGCCIVITMNTVVSDIFMFSLNMVFQISLGRHHKIALFTVIYCVIMPSSNMNSEGLL